MALYAIDYDLRKPGQKYESLFNVLKKFPRWAHILESSWVVESPMTTAQVRDHLLPHVDSNDKIVVKKLTGDAAWYGLESDVSDWLLKARV